MGIVCRDARLKKKFPELIPILAANFTNIALMRAMECPVRSQSMPGYFDLVWHGAGDCAIIQPGVIRSE